MGWAGIFSHRNGRLKCTTHDRTGERSQVASRSGSQKQWCLYHYHESQDCFIWFYMVRVRVCICTFVYVSVYIEKDVHMCSYPSCVCRLWSGCCISRCVCMCVFLLGPSICVSRDRSLAYPSSPRRSRRGGHSKQTQNSHPHAYTLFGAMPIADLRWGRCGLQMPQTHACTHTHAPFPSSEAAKTHSDSSEAEPPPCSMELPSLPHTHKYTFSRSLSHLIFYLRAASVS